MNYGQIHREMQLVMSFGKFPVVMDRGPDAESTD